ncbi:MAG TPA: alanine--glyoxylate aminotransferase family protein [Bryobacteraceae bacterium]|nr:alanine--glyoxylate aminotransferase family protein [Bryobacteraceae bacterium]
MTNIPADYRLRLPGPTAVPERVRQAIALPALNHRGPEFRATFARVEELIKPVMGTANPVLFFASSGTGVMEASLVNVLSPGEAVLVCVSGQFGERFAGIARALGAKVDTLDVEWGRAIDPAEIEARVKAADYRAVVVVHNESSTGVVADVAAIGRILRDTSTLLIVDSVSGLGGLEMRQDEWGIDILVSSSQKCLMCPPGVGLVSVSKKARAVVERDSGMPRFYWDFRKAFAPAEISETPFTPPVALMAGLREALEMIHAEGLPEVLARHRRLSSALRAGCAALGLAPFGDTNSSTVVVMNVPAPLKGGDIVRALYREHRTVIAGSRNKLEGRVIRIGTMGSLNAGDILTDLLHLEATLAALGKQVTPGTGVSVAAGMLEPEKASVHGG